MIRHKQEWRQWSGNDWILLGDHTKCLSFNPEAEEFYPEIKRTGNWENESDKSDKILMMEGADYPYGYIPLYRDRATFLLVMQRNRSLTTEQEESAHKFAMSPDDIPKRREEIIRWMARVRESEGDYE